MKNSLFEICSRSSGKAMTDITVNDLAIASAVCYVPSVIANIVYDFSDESFYCKEQWFKTSNPWTGEISPIWRRFDLTHPFWKQMG